MTTTTLKRLRGVAALLGEAMEQGTLAIEGLHKGTAARPFAILERIPPTAPPARLIRVVHDGVSSVVYGIVRGSGRLMRKAVSLAFDAAERVAVETADDDELS
ncbi:MAG: hypothetical protein ACXWLR_16045 [Myxococcales bacterium]